MKFANLILVFALLIFVKSTEVEFSFALTEVSDIQKDTYGKSLLETITYTLQNNGDIGTVQNLLNDLLFKLEQDQSNADHDWTKENARLLAKIAQLEKEIKKLNLEILEKKAERAKYLKLIEKVKANLKQYKEQLANNLEQIQYITKKRIDDKLDFKRSQEEHKDLVAALTTVINELKLLIGSISGKGKPTHVKEISEETRDRLHKAFLQLTNDDKELTEFIQTATSADQDALNKLIGLMEKLRAGAEKSFNEDQTDEKKSIELFKKLKLTLENDVKKLKNMIATSEKNQITYEKRVKELTIEILAKLALVKAKTSEREATIKERELKERQYKADKAEREREMKIIRKLQDIVKKRLANMTAYLKKNTGA